MTPQISFTGGSTWKERFVIVALIFLLGGVAILIAATRETGAVSRVSSGGSRTEVAAAQPAGAVAAGRTLFHKSGCIACHRPDGSGHGPSLHGLVGRVVADQGYGAAIVDESYIREAILNPMGTVAAGYPPIMPTFEELTDEDLRVLVAYVSSLGDTQTE
jgi:mono/diheme cytochrome c family protein